MTDPRLSADPCRGQFCGLNPLRTRAALPDGLCIEVGAGDGQLRALLPAGLGDRLVHTEPIAEGLRKLRSGHPEARAARATAGALPFRDGTASCVLAACLFDMVTDLTAMVRECSRVLRPGGVVVHVLDMAPDVRPVLVRLTDVRGRRTVLRLPVRHGAAESLRPKPWGS